MEAQRKNGAGGVEINAALVRGLLVRFLADETAAAGFGRAVIGLSGGVDSAVVAALAAEALGHKSVLGIIMPYRLSNPESAAHAELVAAKLGIPTETVDISAMADAYCEEQKVRDQVRRGNVLARMRMIVLYDRSARDKALVFGTGNKTEIMLGYGTLHGDMASAINPIGDLYKTQVWALARELGVPDEIIAKKPSADLWSGQTDEGEMGFAYRDVDRLLYAMVDERRSEEDLRAMGFGKTFVAKVREMIRRNQFKRRPPLIAKISYRTVNVDFRYIRDWGI